MHCPVGKKRTPPNHPVGWHCDDEDLFQDDDVTIISLSLGADRNFDFKLKNDSHFQSICLGSGDLCIMGGAFQDHFLHRLRPASSACAPRISLTWSIGQTYRR